MREVKIIREGRLADFETKINELLAKGFKLDTNFKIEDDGTLYALMFK